MAELLKVYKSRYGWEMEVPTWFAPLPLSEEDAVAHLFGRACQETFALIENPAATLTWDLAGGAPFDEESICRFLYVLERANPVDIDVLVRVLSPLIPPIGTVYGAGAIQLADGQLAMEVFETIESKSGLLKSYQVLFEWPTRRHWPSSKMMTCMQAYSDPFEKGVIFAYREERAGYKNGRAEAVTVGEPERLQRIRFCAPAPEFDKKITVIRQCAVTFELKIKPAQTWNELNTCAPTARQVIESLHARKVFATMDANPGGLKKRATAERNISALRAMLPPQGRPPE